MARVMRNPQCLNPSLNQSNTQHHSKSNITNQATTQYTTNSNTPQAKLVHTTDINTDMVYKSYCAKGNNQSNNKGFTMTTTTDTTATETIATTSPLLMAIDSTIGTERARAIANKYFRAELAELSDAELIQVIKYANSDRKELIKTHSMSSLAGMALGIAGAIILGTSTGM